MSNIIIIIKKIKPRHEECEFCHQVIDKSETLLGASIEFTENELDVNEFSALKQIIFNAVENFMKALTVRSSENTKTTIPQDTGNKSKFTAIPPPEKEPPN